MPMNARLLRPIASRSVIDADATAYLNAVQLADGQALEPLVRAAIANFIVGCKQDGVWSAIKAGCILMGARTLSGALTPLVGTAPTNQGPFVSGDYSRRNGLTAPGDGTKWLDIRANNADPQNDRHFCVLSSGNMSGQAVGSAVASGASWLVTSAANGTFARSSSAGSASGITGIGTIDPFTGFAGVSRSNSTSFDVRVGTATGTASGTSVTPSSDPITLFRGAVGSATPVATGTSCFVSVGTSVNLALLASRLATLRTAITSLL